MFKRYADSEKWDLGFLTGGIMKHSIAGVLGISALLIAAPLGAHAADLAVKAPPPVVAPSDWTGLYFDVDVGWEQQKINWALTNPVPATIPAFSINSNQGALAGHVGYQQQFGWLVVGGEVGATRALNQAWASATANGTAVGPACYGPANNRCQGIIGDLTLAGGKVGFAWQDWLFYGVAGGAWGTVQTHVIAPTGALFDFTANQNRTGWYAGGGVDFMLIKTRFGDAIVGAEYEHIDLKTSFQASSADAFAPSPPGVNGRNVGATEDLVLAKFTLKLNPFN